MRVMVQYPFEWVGFMSFFLLSAVFIPFGPRIAPFIISMLSHIPVENELTDTIISSVDGGAELAARHPGNATSLVAAAEVHSNVTSPEDFVRHWRFDHRYSITMNTLMIGPLVVAVWLDFLFKNLIHLLVYKRRLYLSERRGKRLRYSVRPVIWLTCCCGLHEPDLQDALAEEVGAFDGGSSADLFGKRGAAVAGRTPSEGNLEESVDVVTDAGNVAADQRPLLDESVEVHGGGDGGSDGSGGTGLMHTDSKLKPAGIAVQATRRIRVRTASQTWVRDATEIPDHLFYAEGDRRLHAQLEQMYAINDTEFRSLPVVDHGSWQVSRSNNGHT